jgi:uncharacterized protein (TIGR00299 family) protein
MTRVAYVDPVGGLAGDMILAALIDVGASLAGIQERIDEVVPNGLRLRTEQVHRGGLAGVLLRIDSTRPTKEAGQTTSRSFSELMEILESARLPESVRVKAMSVLRRLGEAEASVHGRELAGLRLHELADDDTLIDIVGVASALEALGVERVLVGPIPVAFGGLTRGSHGNLPLPAPATLELLRGFPIRGEAGGELVTPTGAAIIAALATPTVVLPSMTFTDIGCGAGSRAPEGYPNIVRVLLGTLAPNGADRPRESELLVVEANLDDLTAELAADAAEALRGAGAVDVWATPIHMKKNRAAITLSALCDAASEGTIRRTFFESTSTFGVRTYPVRRAELDRRIDQIPLRNGLVRVKLGFLAGELMSVKPEHDDVAELARQQGVPARRVYEEAVAVAHSLRELPGRFAPAESPG